MSQSTDDPRIAELQAQLQERDRLEQQLSEAREALDREAFRLDAIEIGSEIAEEDIRELESFSLTGVVSSLLGTKAGEIDTFRRKIEELEQQHRECTASIESLRQQVEQLSGQLAGYANVEAELQALCPADGEEAVDDGTGGGTADVTEAQRRLRWAREAGASLLDLLGTMHRLCSQLRSGPSPLFGGSGALVSGALQIVRNRAANDATGQIAEAVARFRERLEQLPLDPESPADAEILAANAQLERFADAGGRELNSGIDGWAELEVLTRSVVSDLEDRLDGCQA